MLNPVNIDSTLYIKDVHWNIKRSAKGHSTQLKNGGVKKPSAGRVPDPSSKGGKRQPASLGVARLEALIKDKVQSSVKKSTMGALFRFFGCPRHGLQKDDLARRLEKSWGIQAPADDINDLYVKWGAPRGLISFPHFLSQVLPPDYADSEAFTFRAADPKKQTSRIRENASQFGSSNTTRNYEGRALRRAKTKFVERLEQIASLNNRLPAEELQALLRRRGLNVAGHLKPTELNELLIMGLNIRGINEAENMVDALKTAQGGEERIPVFDMLKGHRKQARQAQKSRRMPTRKLIRRAARASQKRKLQPTTRPQLQHSMPRLPALRASGASKAPATSAISMPAIYTDAPTAPRGKPSSDVERARQALRQDISSLQQELERKRLIKTQRQLRERIDALGRGGGGGTEGWPGGP